MTLSLSTCLAANSEPPLEALSHYLKRYGIQNSYLLAGLTWQDRERLIDEEKLEMVWLCGLLYSLKQAQGHNWLPIAAPVMLGEDYQDKPIYQCLKHGRPHP
ncbi:MAG: hypothetical protein R2880_04115 [Deinococcales bacterium]